MGRFRSKGDSLRFGLSFFGISGAIAGSLFCNGMTGEMKQELFLQAKEIFSESVLINVESQDVFLQILSKRLGSVFFLFLVSATPYASLLFLLITGYIGFSASILICSMTMSAGIWGVWKCLLLLFPHGIIYGFVFYILAWWMMPEGKALRAGGVLALTFISMAGIAAECMMNPWFLTFLW